MKLHNMQRIESAYNSSSIKLCIYNLNKDYIESG